MDSNSKFIPGLLSYKIVDYGDYHQCLKSAYMMENVTKFYGRYSLIAIEWIPRETSGYNESERTLDEEKISWMTAAYTHHKEFLEFATMTQAVCYPSTCSRSDIQKVLEYFNNKYFSHIKLRILTSESNHDENEWPLYRKISMAILAPLILTTISASSFDMEFLEPFDARINFKKLFGIKNTVTKNPRIQNGESVFKKLEFLNGLKSFYIFKTVAGHTSYLPMSSTYQSLLTPAYTLFEHDHTYWKHLTRTGSIAVSNNSNISALTSMLIWFPIFESKKGNVGFLTFIIPRFLRTLPTIIGYQLVVFAINPFGYGPLSGYAHNNLTGNCLSNGWTEILSISNHLDYYYACNVTGWYLSVDFQLYVMSYVIIYMFYSRPKTGILCCTIFSITATVMRMHHMDEYNVRLFFEFLPFSYASKLFVVAHAALHIYVAPYFIGTVFGYFMLEHNTNISNFYVAIASVSYLTVAVAVFTLYNYKMLSRAQEIILAPIVTAYESFFNSFFIYVLFQNQDWMITRFLSNYSFKILSKLILVLFPMSVLVIIYVYAHPSSVPGMMLYDVLSRSFIVFTLSVLVSIIFHLLIEAPFANLTKMLFTRVRNDFNNNTTSLNDKKE